MLNVVSRAAPLVPRTLAVGTREPTSRSAVRRAAAASSRVEVPKLVSPWTGEPWMLISRPVLSTWAFSPLPKTGTDPAYWV